MKQLGTLVFLGLLCTAAPAAAADDILIQWRAFPDPAEICAASSWPTCYHVRNGVQYKKELSLSRAKDSEGLEYGRRFYQFDGVNDYIWIQTPLADADTDDGLTVRAWFRPDVLSGRQVVISNKNSAGFSLHLDGNRVVGEVNIAGAYYSVTSLTSVVRLGKWNQATFVVDLDGDDMESSHLDDGGENRALLTLIVNGHESGASHVLGPVGTNPRIVNSTKGLLVGAEPNANGAPTERFFKGAIEAVNVRNYPIEHDSSHPDAHLGANDWLKVPPPEDGGIKGGEPSYYDYRVHEVDLTVDARFADPDLPDEEDTYDSARVQIHSLVPFINDEYVVQGIASTCPAVGVCANERLFLSLYWGGKGPTQNPSLIVEIDPKAKSGGRVLSCRALQGKLGQSHVAGLGYDAGMLYVGSTIEEAGVWTSYAERYPIWPQGGTGSCETLGAARRDVIFDGGSLSIQDGFLLVSDFWRQQEDDDDELVCEGECVNECFGPYEGEDVVECAKLCVGDNECVDECEVECVGECVGDEECEAECEVADECVDECEVECENDPPPKLIVYKIKSNGLTVQAGRYCLPDLVEGAAFVGFDPLAFPADLVPSYLVLSHLGDGLIRIAAQHVYQPTDTGDCTRPAPGGIVPIARSAKGSQDLAITSSGVWFANESGSKSIQTEGGGWPNLFPFVTWVNLYASDFP